MEILNRLVEILQEPLIQISNVPISLWLLAKTILILLVTALLSRFVRRLLRRNVFVYTDLTVGVQASITRVLHYLIMILGAFIALQNLGIDLTALAAVGAIFMVGIGFGLQNITSNFISGLILLFERPIQVGNFVEVGGVLGTVAAINARSTTVDTLDTQIGPRALYRVVPEPDEGVGPGSRRVGVLGFNLLPSNFYLLNSCPFSRRS